MFCGAAAEGVAPGAVGAMESSPRLPRFSRPPEDRKLMMISPNKQAAKQEGSGHGCARRLLQFFCGETETETALVSSLLGKGWEAVLNFEPIAVVLN